MLIILKSIWLGSGYAALDKMLVLPSSAADRFSVTVVNLRKHRYFYGVLICDNVLDHSILSMSNLVMRNDEGKAYISLFKATYIVMVS